MPALPPLVLAIDLGTSALKAGVCDAAGRLHASVALPLAPLRGGEGRAEGDPSGWAEAAFAAARELAAAVPAARIHAVVLSGHGPSLVAVDESGAPLGPSLLWLDRRAAAEAEEIGSRWGRAVESWYFLPKALWLARHEPERYRRTRWLLSAPEFLGHLLTGGSCTVLHTEAFRHYYWDREIAASVGVDPAKLPPFVTPGFRIGALGGAAAERAALAVGTPIFAGGPDFLMSLLGTATVAPGRVCDRAGSSEGVNLCAERELRDPRLQCQPHVVSPFWNVAGMISASGLSLEWVRTAGGGRESHEELFALAEQAPPGSRGLLFLPFTGPGGTGAFAGLTLSHGRAEMVRAVVESVGLGLRDILRAMEENGAQVRYMTVTGGQARLEGWTQLKADITGVPVRVPVVADAEIVGGAAVGFVALGEHAGLREASEAMVRIARVLEPRESIAARYAELEPRLRGARRGLPEAMARVLSGAEG